MTQSPFALHISEMVLTDVQERLALTRWTDEIAGAGWGYGTNLAYLKQLVAYWQDTFDWRTQERLLNKFPRFKGKGSVPVQRDSVRVLWPVQAHRLSSPSLWLSAGG